MFGEFTNIGMNSEISIGDLAKKIAQLMNIDLSRSFIIGDRSVDIQTGINAGLDTILLKTGENGKDGKYNGDLISYSVPIMFIKFLYTKPGL